MHKVLTYKRIWLPILLFTIALGSCKKTTTTNPANLLEQYFDANILGQIFIVNLATDNGTDLTANYSGYTFKLIKSDYYQGPIEVKYGTNTYSGTWSANSDYSKLTLILPSVPSLFIFLTRDWRFTSKNVPQLELAPWGTTDPVVLHILRQ